jgi:hypothetical protein
MSDLKKTSQNEEEYFARRDAELMKQMRASAEQAKAEAERKSHHMKCPKCGFDLITADFHGVTIDQCTNCHGIWFDAGEAESLLKSDQGGLFGRVVGSVIKGVRGAKAAGK